MALGAHPVTGGCGDLPPEHGAAALGPHGAGLAKDGKPKFDLEQLDQAYFDRLRDRVVKAGEAGIYVGVLLFDGWAVHLSPQPDQTEGHPFHELNNVNGIAATSIDDVQVLPLDARVEAIQEAYIRKVVDTLHDLPNVLWEVANESSGDGSVTKEFAEFLGMTEPPVWGDTTDWQYWVIDVVKGHEADKGYDAHPIGMSMQFPVKDQTRVNEPLLRSRAEWISPGFDDEIFTEGRSPMAPGSPPSRWYDDPPPADGRKVVLNDTDHYAQAVDALWAWKSFLRGHHPVLMDYGLIGAFDVGAKPAPKAAAAAEPTAVPEAGAAPASEAGVPPFEAFEPARYAMGDTRGYAERIGLIDMEPLGDLASTGYVLANPGREYLVLQPSAAAEPFTVNLDLGTYAVEWHGVSSRATQAADGVTTDGTGAVEFSPPFIDAEPAVLYLRRT